MRIILSLVLLTGMLATLRAPIGYVIEEEHQVTYSKNAGEEGSEDEGERSGQKRSGSDYLSASPGAIRNPSIPTAFYFRDYPDDALQLRAAGYTAPPPEIV